MGSPRTRCAAGPADRTVPTRIPARRPVGQDADPRHWDQPSAPSWGDQKSAARADFWVSPPRPAPRCVFRPSAAAPRPARTAARRSCPPACCPGAANCAADSGKQRWSRNDLPPLIERKNPRNRGFGRSLPIAAKCRQIKGMGPRRFERPTSSLSGTRSNLLSYNRV